MELRRATWKKRNGTLIKIVEIKRSINAENTYDSLLIWYRDEKGIKQCRFIDRTEVPFYILKDKNSKEAIIPPMFIEKDKVEKITTFSDMLYRDIAIRTDSLAFYDMCIERKNKTNLKNLLKHNLIYNADMDISDRYIKMFYEEFDPNINYKLHKCFMDIEVDLMPNGFDDKGYIGFPNEDIAPVPINIITLIDSKMMNIYVFVIKNKKNNELIKVENKISEINNRLIKEFGEKDAAFFNLIETNFYNSEEDAIIAFFNKVHEIDPDVCARMECRI